MTLASKLDSVKPRINREAPESPKKVAVGRAHKLMNTSANSFRWEKDPDTHQIVDYRPVEPYKNIKKGLAVNLAIGGSALLA